MPRTARGRTAVLAGGVVLPLAVGALVLLVAVRTGTGQHLDAAALAVLSVTDPVLGGAARLLRELVLLGAAAALAWQVVRAVRRGERRTVVVAVLLPAVAAGAAVVLRDHVVHRPWLGDNGYPYNTFPSAHTATLAALCVGIVLLAGTGSRLRGPAVLGFVLAAGVWSNVATMSHRPSDVVGSLLLVTALATPAVLVAGSASPARRHGSEDRTNAK